MGDSSIEWTDATWNPVRGCTRVSPGCENCYAEKVAARFSGPGLAYEGLAFSALMSEMAGDPYLYKMRWSQVVHVDRRRAIVAKVAP